MDMTDPREDIVVAAYYTRSHLAAGETIDGWQPMLSLGKTFTRSNNTIISRIYERLTKASRRRHHTMLDGWSNVEQEEAYRRGVYDGFKALQEELS